jgi:hypothetical protein
VKRLAAATLALALTSAGCHGMPVHIDNVVPDDLDHSTGRVVEGDAYGFQFILLIPMGVNTRHARAWADLQEKAGDAYVTDVELKEGWFYGLVGTLYHTTFRAKAYPRRAVAASDLRP